MKNNVEIWKNILDYEGLYSVSSLGRVRADYSTNRYKNGRILKPCINSTKYFVHRLSKYSVGKTFTLHRLVAEAFLGKRPEGYEVNHIDGNKLNNRLDNLEYVTGSQNVKHAYNIGLKIGNFGDKNGSRTRPDRLARGDKSAYRLHPEKYPKGEKHHKSVFPDSEIPKIFELRRNGKLLREIACLYNVSITCIAYILNGKSRKINKN